MDVSITDLARQKCLACDNHFMGFLGELCEECRQPALNQMHHAHALYTEAETTINGPRRASYGEVQASFTKVGNMWGEILGVKVSAAQVALMMVAFKVCREANAHKRDNLVDICGYAGLLAELEEGK